MRSEEKRVKAGRDACTLPTNGDFSCSGNASVDEAQYFLLNDACGGMAAEA